MTRSLSRRRGHTFLEVLFAGFLAVVAALIMAVSMPVANVSRAKADMQNVALGLAQKQMEAIKGVDQTLSPQVLFAAGLIDSLDPVEANVWTFTNVDNGVFDSPADVLPGGTGRITIELVDIELRRVTVEVAWVDRGETRTVTLGSLIAVLNS